MDEHNLRVLLNGFADEISVLSYDDLDQIVGGDVDCKKKFVDGHVECHRRYKEKNGFFTCSKDYKWKD